MIRLSIIIPAFNEEKTIIKILDKVNKVKIEGVEKEIIVVDDCSQDGTLELLKNNNKLYSLLIKLNKNRGKGAAVKKGLSKATGKYILFQDADLEYDPNDYVKLMEPVLRFNADVVMGSRISAPPFTRVYYFWHKVGNRFITLVFNILNNTTFTDIYSCYLLFKTSLIKPQELVTNGWEQQAEILTIVVSKAKSLYEVPINYYGRTYAEGKKIRPLNVVSVLLTIFLRKFLTF
tara:strand:- start:380 stop:1078 length:699 start_codon:yes stop_codon:yes gene_type:complete